MYANTEIGHTRAMTSAADTSCAPLNQGTALCAGRYTTAELLAQGGSGEVYRVYDHTQGVWRALKRLHQEHATSALEREFSLLARLSHPCLVQVHDFFRQPEGRACFTMDLLDGAGDPQRLQGLCLDEVILLARDLLWGLAYLHAQNILHADIKPGNIHRPTHGGPARLLDFGLWQTGEQNTACGTLQYMAPELLKDQPHSVASDLYSLGAVLFEALTGHPPFANADTSLVQMKLEAPAPSARQARPNLPPAIDEVIQQLLQTAPEARLRSAQEAAWALAGASQAQELFAPIFTPGAGGRLKLVGRHQTLQTLNQKLGRQHTPTEASVVWLSGDVGVGKSRLIEEAALQARLDGHETFTVTATSAASELCTRLNLNPDCAPGSERWCQELTDALIANAPDRKSTLVFVDCAASLAPPTRQWLASVAKRGGHCPLQIAVAARPQQSPTEGARIQPLDALSHDGTARLLGAALGMDDPELVDVIHRATDGNPSMALLHLKHLTSTRALRWHKGRWRVDIDAARLQRPDHLWSARVGQWLDTLDNQEHALFELVAIFEDGAPTDALHTLLPGVDVDALVARHTEDLHHQDTLQLRQRSMREGLLEHLPPARRKTLHQRVLGWLDSTPEPALTSVLEHALGAGALTRAAQAAMVLGRAANQRAQPWQGARIIRQVALALEAAQAPAELERAVLQALGESQLAAGQVREATASFSKALSLHPSPPGALCLALAQALGEAGEHQSALEAFEAAHQAADSSAELDIHFGMGWSLTMLGQYKEANARFQEGLSASTALDDAKAQARMHYGAGTACWQSDQHQQATKHLTLAVQMASHTAQRRLQADAQLGLGTALRHMGKMAQANEVYQQAADAFKVLGLLSQQAKCLNNMGVVAYLQGDWAEAQRQWETFEVLVERLGMDIEVVNACNNLGTLNKDRGALEKAVSLFDKGLQRAKRMGYARIEAMLHGNRAEALMRMGKLQDAALALDTCQRQAEALDAKGELLEVERRRAQLWLAHNDPSAALQTARDALRWSAAQNAPLERALLMSLQAMAQSQLGSPEAARLTIGQALETLRELGALYELGQALVIAGKVALSDDRPQDARLHLHEATEVLEPLGAMAELTQARRTLEEAVATVRREHQTQHRMKIVLEMARRLGTHQTLDTLLLEIVQAALEITGLERGFVILFDQDGQPTIQAAQNIDADQLEARSDRPCYSIAARVFERREPVGALDLDQDPRFGAQASVLLMGIRSVRCVPILSQDQPIGVLYADSRQVARAWQIQEDLELLEALASQAGVFIHNTRLLDKERHKNRLLATTAHEINRPLSSLLLFAQDLLHHSPSLDDEDRTAVEIIERQARRLSRLTKGMLRMARTSSEQLRLELMPLEIGPLLRAVAAEHMPLVNQQGLNLEIYAPADIQALGDRDRLIQIATNLLGNAIKFTPQGGTITVRLRQGPTERPSQQRKRWARRVEPWQAQQDPDHQVVMEVEDSGPGIAKEHAQRIFESFVQVHPEAEKRSAGVGLGLSIVRELVAAHHGRVWVEQAQPHGARFCVALMAVSKKTH